jgi:hypothetical protein
MTGIANTARTTGCRELLSLAHPQTVSCAHEDIGGEDKQQGTTYPARPLFDSLGKLSAPTHLDIQPPQQHTCGCEFYQAIRAEGDQGEAVRGGT